MAASKRRVPRLFVDRELAGESLSLDEREAHYIGHVLRLKRGDELVAFNGRGTERGAVVSSLRRHDAELTLKGTLSPLPAPRLELTIIQGLTKADAMDLVVQKTTELGVSAILPVYTELGVVKLDQERIERRVEHLWVDDDQPLTLGIVADLSTSQAARHAEQRSSIIALAEQVLLREAMCSGKSHHEIGTHCWCMWQTCAQPSVSCEHGPSSA